MLTTLSPRCSLSLSLSSPRSFRQNTTDAEASMTAVTVLPHQPGGGPGPRLRQALYSEDRMSGLKAISSKLQKRTKSRKQVKEEIGWARADTRKAVAKMLKQ